MTATELTGQLDPRFSSEDAAPTSWSDARHELDEAEIFWVATVRPDGRPHVTPLIAVWLDDALCFCTGPDERKGKNLEHNAHCVVTTGSNAYREGLDVIVEGDAARVTDDAKLRHLAEAFESKYGSEWHFEVRDGAFEHGPGRAFVFVVEPTAVFAFGRGDTYSQTRWDF